MKIKPRKRFRRNRRNLPHDPTHHHRKPTSLGGKDLSNNTSIVTREQHEAWHLLFDNLPAPQVLSRFVEFLEIFGANAERMTIHQEMRIYQWVRSSRSRMKKKQAWIILFGKSSLEEIIGQINSVWIDPDYELLLETRLVKVVAIKLLQLEKITQQRRQPSTP